MAYNAALNTVYNHYLSAYAPASMRPSQYDTHKKSELRSIYNSIIKMNKEAPLFLHDNTKESREFAVGLKENARQLRNTIASLGGLNETEMLNKKAAYSTNPKVVGVTFTGNYESDAEAPSFDISVTNLASPQINRGHYLPENNKIALSPDFYSFDISVGELNYEFQFNIHEGETNADVQNRLARLFNNSEIGLSAEVIHNDSDGSALRLTSNATGLPPEKSALFRINDDNATKSTGAVSYLGLDQVSQPAANARFSINGEEHTAYSNQFTVEKMYELHLNGITQEHEAPIHVGLKTDTESIKENIGELIQGYNSFLTSSSPYTENHPKSNRFLNEMSGIVTYYQDNMASLGVQIQENGQLTLADQDKLSEVLWDDDEGRERFGVVKDFTNSVLRKVNQISINPMDYVDKKIIAYKNPGRNFANPYVTSAYSGMMFNSYC